MEPEDVVLMRIDRSRNMARFYRLSIEPALFGGFVLHRSWGAPRNLGGQTRLEHCADLAAARARKAELTAQKAPERL
ncbi:WGR domain-containing protein [Roseibium salinum]|nr:WGR domain-containing protein [Roseibium salinum]